MLIYQNGKLYVQHGDNIIGVEIYPDKIIKVDGSEEKLSEKYQVLTPYEVRCKWHITKDNFYIFPTKPKFKDPIGDDVDVSTIDIKKYTRKSTRK